MTDRWIVIPRWDDFQHYKDRDPVWIKTFTRQMRDDAYLQLTLSQRGLLHDIRLLYAESNGVLTERRLRHRVGTNKATTRHLRRHLETLETLGWIAFDASEPLPKRQSKRHKGLSEPVENLRTLKKPCPECQLELSPVSWLDHMRNVHNQEIA